MNAGRSYPRAARQAQANANWSRQTRFLHQHNGVWWISTERPDVLCEVFEVQPDEPLDLLSACRHARECIAGRFGWGALEAVLDAAIAQAERSRQEDRDAIR
jgi:hypothetical protein